MVVLMIGNRLGHLKELAKTLHLCEDEVIFAQTRTELQMIDLKEVKIVFVDLLWTYKDKNPANIELAIRQLRDAGFIGTIEACAINPHGNSYIVKLLGGLSVWGTPEEKEYPDLFWKSC